MKSKWKEFTSICNYKLIDKEFWHIYKEWSAWGDDYKIVIKPYCLPLLTVSLVAYRRSEEK